MNSTNEKEKIEYNIIVTRISIKNYNEPTPSNIKKIYNKINTNQIFGASNVVEILNCSYATAKAIINKLHKDIDVIVPVIGFGKGKYRFKNKGEE